MRLSGSSFASFTALAHLSDRFVVFGSPKRIFDEVVKRMLVLSIVRRFQLMYRFYTTSHKWKWWHTRDIDGECKMLRIMPILTCHAHFLQFVHFATISFPLQLHQTLPMAQMPCRWSTDTPNTKRNVELVCTSASCQSTVNIELKLVSPIFSINSVFCPSQTLAPFDANSKQHSCCNCCHWGSRRAHLVWHDCNCVFQGPCLTMWNTPHIPDFQWQLLWLLAQCTMQTVQSGILSSDAQHQNVTRCSFACHAMTIAGCKSLCGNLD